MSITDKIDGKKEEKELEAQIKDTPKKLSKEEKERIIKEEMGKAQYYETLEC